MKPAFTCYYMEKKIIEELTSLLVKHSSDEVKIRGQFASDIIDILSQNGSSAVLEGNSLINAIFDSAVKCLDVVDKPDAYNHRKKKLCKYIWRLQRFTDMSKLTPIYPALFWIIDKFNIKEGGFGRGIRVNQIIEAYDDYYLVELYIDNKLYLLANADEIGSSDEAVRLAQDLGRYDDGMYVIQVKRYLQQDASGNIVQAAGIIDESLNEYVLIKASLL